MGAIPVMVRLLPRQATCLDEWRTGHVDRPGRPEAIRRLIEQTLAGTGAAQKPSRKQRHSGKARRS